VLLPTLVEIIELTTLMYFLRRPGVLFLLKTINLIEETLENLSLEPLIKLKVTIEFDWSFSQ